MKHLHYFNPGHEAAVGIRSAAYTPPANVARMASELRLIPAWYADEGDFVYTGDLPTDDSFFRSLPPELRPPGLPVDAAKLAKGTGLPPTLQVEPWGVSLQCLSLFKTLSGEVAVELCLPTWNEEYPTLVHRQTAAACLRRLQTEHPTLQLPHPALHCTNMEQVDRYMAVHRPPHLFKQPYSSSGRGLLWIEAETLTLKEREWISGPIKRQGGIGVEAALRRITEFAWEYRSDGRGSVHYEGFSCFDTSHRGAYRGNRLNAWKEEDSIRGLLSDGAYDYMKEAVGEVLKKELSMRYKGYLGVDMLIYQTDDGRRLLYPFMEINLRRTFGLVAQRISERIVAPGASGRLEVVYHRQTGKALEQHHHLSQLHPLRTEHGKLIAGYLPLCPVTPSSHYMAFLLI